MTDSDDTIYAMTVNPRRNAGRALAHFDAGNLPVAREYIVDTYEGLMAIGEFYREISSVDDEEFKARVLKIVSENAEALDLLKKNGD